MLRAKELYSIKRVGFIGLSETPEKMSKDWGSEHYRICVYVVLKDKASGKEFAVFNTPSTTRAISHASTASRSCWIKYPSSEIFPHILWEI